MLLRLGRADKGDFSPKPLTDPELPKRTRYYQSMIDADALEHSIRYSELPNSYVIFISLDNPFKKYGLHKYTFVSRCEEDSRIRLEDGAKRIFISAKGSTDDISDDMKSFLSYLTDQSTESDLTRRLEKAVRDAKERREWSVEYVHRHLTPGSPIGVSSAKIPQRMP